MGCSFSRPSRRDADSNPRIFKVFNVDDQGQELNAGKIEITEVDLVLHQKSKEPIRWPLRSLRRYGFDAELFSFESGRRCPTGPGIYAFKCRRAEALFNLLQECIQRAGQEEQAQQRPSLATGGTAESAVTTTVGTPGSTVAGRPGTLAEIHTPNGSLPAFTGGSMASSVGGVSTGAPSPHHYINGYVVPQSPPHGGAIPCTCPPAAHGTNAPHSASSSSSMVINAGSGGIVVVGNPRMNAAHEYVNTDIAVGAVGPNSSSARAGSHQSLDLSNVQLRMLPAGTQRPSVIDTQVINYAELDLPKSLEELHYGSGSGAAGGCVHHHLPLQHQGVIVELDPSSSQATYINVPADNTNNPPPNPTFKRTLEPSSSAAVLVNGASSATGSTVVPAMCKVLVRQVSKDDQHNYANLDILSSAAARGGGEVMRGRGKVTYIQVDVRSSKENLYAGINPPASPISLSPSIPDSPRRTESYAQIDFHKTAALSKVANSEDEGSRKTRHNSNIEELN